LLARRLDVLGSEVDVAIEVELDDDLRHAERAQRRHLGDARNLPELTLERGRDRRRHGLGTAAGKRRGHLHGRKVDLRQRRHR
jgi:hypothetical protein